jgi:hypothetical protein
MSLQTRLIYWVISKFSISINIASEAAGGYTLVPQRRNKQYNFINQDFVKTNFSLSKLVLSTLYIMYVSDVSRPARKEKPRLSLCSLLQTLESFCILLNLDLKTSTLIN